MACVYSPGQWSECTPSAECGNIECVRFLVNFIDFQLISLHVHVNIGKWKNNLEENQNKDF